jgi:hypothetical protein
MLKKSTQQRHMDPLESPKQVVTFQRVFVDSLEVGVNEIGCKCAPDHWQCRQEAPQRCLAMLAWFSCFFDKT